MIRPVRIFLSSPGDVAAERDKARELLLGLARGPFVRGHVHIDVVSWDDPHAPAPMDARLAPQEAINRGLPTPAECDLTVVLLWGRMGTPLTEKKADGAPYLSGTEWEFENALGASKPVLVYRRSEKVLLDPDEEDFDERLTQKRRVDQFFGRFTTADGAIRHSHATYVSTDELLKRLQQDVDHYLSELLENVDQDNDRDGEDRAGARRGQYDQGASGPPDVPVAYREWVKKQYGGVDLLGLQLKKGRPPSLSAIYVPQTTTAPASAEEQPRRRGLRPGIDADMRGRERERHTLALARLATDSLYVSGAPGTGKSTFCRWVVWLVAEGAMPPVDVRAPDDFAENLDDGLKGRLPVLLRLREFWEYLPARAGASLTVFDLEDAIGSWMDKKHPDALDARLLRAHLAHGSALLILDGMDEVPKISHTTTSGKWHPRQQLLSALADACPAWSAAGNRLLLTSRPYGLSGEEAARLALGDAPLQPLPRELQSLLAHRWFSVLSADARSGAEIAAELFANIDSQPWLAELAANPLLLTAMCIVFDEGKRLPQDQHDLYERVMATVLFSRYPTPAEIDKAKRELGVIAYGMHTGAGFNDGRATPKAEATFYEIERWLQDYQSLKEYTERAEAGAFEAREALLSQSGLLLSTGNDRAGFAHLSFQEFFAAQRSFTVDESRLGDVFTARAAVPEWRNTLSFLFGRLVGSFPEPNKAIDLLEARLEGVSAGDPGLLLVLADAAQILMGKGTTLRVESRQRLQRVLLETMTGPAPVAIRADAGSALGRLGDPRFRADRWWLPDEDLLGFIRVEAGPFPMGSDPEKVHRADEDEQPQHVVELPEYYIARYPVTGAQFRAFVEDCQFQVGNRDCLAGVPNHPVRWVSFHEALAYCRWLTDKLRTTESTPQPFRERLTAGWVMTLQSEAEWEKAARGQDARIYPWAGDFNVSYANGRETGLGTTSAVGLFPDGASPCDAVDMSGNVWEWTRSLWGEDFNQTAYSYPYEPTDAKREDLQAPSTVLRVLRGGSFKSDGGSLRAANRGRRDPVSRSGGVGFRMVLVRLVSPPVGFSPGSQALAQARAQNRL